jgi:hypothetical protein
MDHQNYSISPHDPYAVFGSEAAPILIDVRRDTDRVGADALRADGLLVTQRDSIAIGPLPVAQETCR